MAEDLAIKRLQEERIRWRKDHPVGFVARPAKDVNGNLDLFHWKCLIPGPAGSLWEGGLYKVDIQFPKNFPVSNPVAKFDPPVPHVNVFPTGRICLSIIGDGWMPSFNMRQILVGIQNLLITPNPDSPAHEVHYNNFIRNRPLYDENIKKCAAMNRNTTLD